MSEMMPTTELAWTQDLPKIAGYYWILFSFHSEPCIEKVCIESNGEVFGFDFSGEPGGTWYNAQEGHWYYGPIPAPVIPAEIMARHPKLQSIGRDMP